MKPLSHAAAKRRLRDVMFGRSNRAIADYWLSLWSGDNLPAWSAFDRSKVADLAPGIVVFELRSDSTLICILCGEAIQRATGFDLTGKDWAALAAPDQREIRLSGYRDIANGAVGHCIRYGQHRSGEAHYTEEILLPFAANPDGSRTVLAHVGWRPRDQSADGPEIRNSLSIPDEVTLIPLTGE